MAGPGASGLLTDFRWLLISASIATAAGAILIPTFQRVFCLAVLHFQVHRSVPKVILHRFFNGGITYIKDVASVPVADVTDMHRGRGVSGNNGVERNSVLVAQH